MDALEYVVPPECGGMTVKDFARRFLGFSAATLKKQKQMERGILRNGNPCFTTALLAAGDVLAFPFPREEGAYPAVPLELPVVWETDHYLAVDKPFAMPVHPSPGHDRDSLLNAVAYHYRKTGQQRLIRPLYRLDRDTSGLVLLAKHRAAASGQVSLEKRYFALCQGRLSGRGTINLPIGLAPGSRIQRQCGHGDPAVTHWQALGFREGHTLLALRLETGRTHQIRAHMAHIGHPLAGDDLYGGSREKAGRQALHCGWLHVSCPALAVEKQLVSEFPPDLQKAFPWLPEIRTLLKEIEKED